MARSSWKGHIRLSLVSIPVKAFTANATGKEIHLNQLHEECKSRIRYQKTCPQHGEVPFQEIVKGYEFAKDQYVIVDEAELDELRTENDRAINIDCFVSPHQVDVMYFTGKTYYLAPEGHVGQKPYGLLLEAMKQSQLHCIAQVVMHGREQLVMVRPAGKLLCMEVLAYADQVRAPAEFEGEVDEPDFTHDELELTKKLIDATTAAEFDIGRFENVYHDKLKALIEAKIEGKEIVAPSHDQPERIINLMDALKASLARATEASNTKKVAKSSTSRRKKAAESKKTG